MKVGLLTFHSNRIKIIKPMIIQTRDQNLEEKKWKLENSVQKETRDTKGNPQRLHN